MIKLGLLLFCTALPVSQAIAQKEPVTSNSRLVEFYETYKTIDKKQSRENYCESIYRDKDLEILGYLHRLDVSLPVIADSKREKLTAVIRKRKESMDDNYRSHLWHSEMFNDADYWQLSLEHELKPAIQVLKNTVWSYERGVLLSYLNDLRSQKYFSVTKQRVATDLIQKNLEALTTLTRLLQTIDETEIHFLRLSQGSRLQIVDSNYKKLSDYILRRVMWVAEKHTVMVHTFKRLIDCQLRFLGTF
jgi:hypothetical protein